MLSWVCPILGPFREPDVHDQSHASPNQSFHPQQLLPHSWCQAGKEACLEKSGGRFLLQSIWRQLQSSIFIPLLDRPAKPETVPTTHW